MGDWLIELIQGIGRLFIHPFLYVFIIGSILVGYVRVKRERRNFSIRGHRELFELTRYLGMSILLGLGISVITIGIGLVVPMNIIIVSGILSCLFVVTTLFRFVSPVYVFLLSIIVIPICSSMAFVNSRLDGSISILSLVLIVGLFLLLEGILISRGKETLSTPIMENGSRGKHIGYHVARKIWLIPVFMLIPVGDITSSVNWWPVIQIGDGNYSLFLVPFGIGLVQKIMGSVPRRYLSLLSRYIILLSVVIIIMAIVSFWIPVVGYIGLMCAAVGRFYIDVRVRDMDRIRELYFVAKNEGIVVLGVVPDSPAEKMGIRVGEVITKVNGELVHTQDDLYRAINMNRAFSKLEVNDLNGEPRIVSGVMYADSHYELGILYVHE